MNIPIPQWKNRIEYEEFKKTQPNIPLPKITKPAKRHQGVTLSPPMDTILQGSFIALLLGRPGSGKTSLLSQFLNRQQFYGRKFGRILYVTPSDIPGISHDQKINTCRTLDFQWIQKKLKQYQNCCKNILLVIDDVISDIPTHQRCQLKNLFYDRRHVLGPQSCLSIMITSQKYTCVPKWVRTCIDLFVCFSVQPSQIRTISTELNTGKDIRTLTMMFRTLEKHEFLLFNLQKGSCYNSQFIKI